MTARKADGNQAEIVEALRDMGVFVFSLHGVGKGCPDLLCAFRGQWFVAEVKNGSLLGWKLTPKQKEFRIRCGAPIAILDSVESAAAWVNSLATLEKNREMLNARSA